MSFVERIAAEVCGPAIERMDEGFEDLCGEIDKIADAARMRFQQVESQVRKNTVRIAELEREVESLRGETRDMWSRRHEP